MRTHDGKAIEGEELLVCARLFTNIQQLRERVGAQTHLLYALNEDQYIELAESVLKIRHRYIGNKEIFTIAKYDLN